MNGDGGKKRGRPKSYLDAYNAQLNVRMSKDNLDVLDRLSKEKHKSKSELVRLAIMHYINGDFKEF